MNQNPEQLTRDKIDFELIRSGWIIQSKSKINLNAGIGIAIREYQTDIGPADYVLFVNQKPTMKKAIVSFFITDRIGEALKRIARRLSKITEPTRPGRKFKRNHQPKRKHQVNDIAGTTIKHLTGRQLKNIKLSLPSIDEQLNIVQAIESRFSVADKMEESITQSLQQAEALRQSIFKKAFEGRLV